MFNVRPKKKKKTYKLSYLRKKIYVLLNFFKKRVDTESKKLKEFDEQVNSRCPFLEFQLFLSINSAKNKIF